MNDAVREMATLRESVGRMNASHIHVLRIEGDGAFDLLNRLSTAALYLREGQLRHTLFLEETGRVFADVYIGVDDTGYFVLVEGPDREALSGYIEGRREGSTHAVQVIPLSDSHQLWSLHGPYAWEAASAFLGPAVLGMPYLSLLTLDDVVCFRAGKSGEYGYECLVPRERADALREKLDQVGRDLEMRPIGLATLDQAALENWFFSMRFLHETEWASPLSPIELQLQWRVSYDREFVGAESLRARRAKGPAVRSTCFTAALPVQRRETVYYEGRPIGEILEAGWSSTLGQTVGLALLETRYAHPHINEFVARGEQGDVPLRTRTPPLVNNRSLHVDPHRHAYQTRGSDTFPPLVVA